MKKGKLSFRWKVTLILIFCGAIPLFLNNVFIIYFTQRALKEKTITNLQQISIILSEKIKDFFYDCAQTVTLIAKHPVLKEESSAEVLQKTLRDLLIGYPNFQNIILFKENGEIITEVFPIEVGEILQKKVFREAILKKETTISDCFLLEIGTDPLCFVFSPILTEEGKIKALVAATIDYKKLLEILISLRIGERGQAFLVNSENKIIAHPFRSLIFTEAIKESGFPLALEGGFLEFNFRGESFLAYIMNIQNFRKYESPGWKLVIAQPKEEAFKLVEIVRIQTFAILFILIGLLFLVASFISLFITKPLSQLMFVAKELSTGNFNVKAEIKTGDEFEEFGLIFNEMIQDLAKYYLELEKTKKSLELQVMARTKELEELNRNLQKEIERQTQELREKVKELEDSRTALLNILTDAEEARKKAEEERIKTLAIITNFADGLLVFDKFANLILINSKAEEFFEVKGKEIIGKNFSELKSLEKMPYLTKLFSLFEKEIHPIYRKELKLEEKELILEVTAAPIFLEKEEIGKMILLHDVTREKLVEKLKTEFVSISAHQLRTPMSAIKWSLQMVLNEDAGPLTEDQRDLLLKAYESNERTVRLINDLLNVTRIEEGRYIYKLEALDLVSILKDLAKFYKEVAAQKNITFETNLPEKVPLIKGDEEKIKLAITNLIDNAINYTLAGGKVTVTLKEGEKELIFSVQDTGIGIPEKEKARIFTKFFRGVEAMKLQTSGSGLGLFIAKNIVEAHGGKIWFESQEKKGTTFYFTIPIGK